MSFLWGKSMTEEILKKSESDFEEFSKKFSSDESLSVRTKEFWNEAGKKIDRRFRQFNTDQLIIVATGMLKAGKSTFVNLLSRNENASPIGFGVDTTLRPVLIKMAGKDSGSKGGIYIYKRKNISKPENEIQELQNQMEEIIDRIRGLKDFDDNFRQPNPILLNQENLRDVLCSQRSPLIDQSPLLVVVEVPYSEESLVLNENCIIFDMPGLDSTDAEISKNFEMYNAIFKECDLVLFVQSNMAPINEAACGYLEKIGKERSSCTYRLVQNQMKAKFWLKEDVLEEEVKTQAKKGIQNFVKKLNTNRVNENSLKFWSANLGMAYDYIFNKENIESDGEKLFAQSHFLEMEKNIAQDIEENGLEQRRIHCKDELLNTISEVINNISDLNQEISKNGENLTQKINSLIEEKNSLSSAGIKTDDWNGIRFVLSENLKREMNEKMLSEFKKLRASTKYSKILPSNFSAFKIKGSKYNNFLLDCSENAVEIVKQIFEKSYLEEIISTDSKDSDSIRLVNQKIENLNLVSVPKIEYRTKFLKDGNIGEIDSIEMAQIESHKKTGKFLWFEYEKSFDINDSMIRSDLEKIAEHYIEQIQRYLNFNFFRIITSIANSHISSSMEKLVAEKEACVQNLKQEKDSLDYDRKRILEGRDFLSEMKENISL